MVAYGAGNVITFSYIGDRSHDRQPIVLVVHPMWESTTQGIAIQHLTPEHIDFLKYLTQRGFNDGRFESFKKLKEKIVSNLTPLNVYTQIVLRFPFFREAYRKYVPYKMKGVRLVRRRL